MDIDGETIVFNDMSVRCVDAFEEHLKSRFLLDHFLDLFDKSAK